MGPVYRLNGIRYGGGVNLVQAFVCNVGTCCSDEKGEIQVEDPREGEYRGRAQGRITL
jgi:hypothetical protein